MKETNQIILVTGATGNQGMMKTGLVSLQE